jgi:hypothetical protein
LYGIAVVAFFIAAAIVGLLGFARPLWLGVTAATVVAMVVVIGCRRLSVYSDPASCVDDCPGFERAMAHWYIGGLLVGLVIGVTIRASRHAVRPSP